MRYPVILLALAFVCFGSIDPDLYWHRYIGFGDVPNELQSGGFGMINSTHGVYYGGYSSAPCFNSPNACPATMSDKTFIGTPVNSTHWRWVRVFPPVSPSARAVFSGYCTMKDTQKFYVFGGIDINSFQTNPDLWEFDASTITWTKLSFNGPGSRMSGFIACKDGEVWVFSGGIIDLGSFSFFTVNDVWFYNVQRRTWTQTNAIESTPNNQPDDHIPPHQRYNNAGDCVGNKCAYLWGDALPFTGDDTVMDGVFLATTHNVHPVEYAFLGSKANRTLTFMRCDGKKKCIAPFGDLGTGLLPCLAGTGNSDTPTNETVIVNLNNGLVQSLSLASGHASPAIKAHCGDLWIRDDGTSQILTVGGYSVSCLTPTTAQFAYNTDVYALPSGLI